MTESIVVIPGDVADFLEHYGIKGMRWGIRRQDPSGGGPAPNVGAPGVTARADGSISIEKGASLQRLVRSNGKSMPMKGLTYASMLEYDNARYIKTIGGKGFLGGGRDQILGLTATKKIEAPSRDEATRMVSEMMLKNPEFRKRNTILFGGPISDRELERIRQDPVGKDARTLYEMTNTKMTLSGDFDPDAPYVQKALREEVLSRGYNALRDENDAGGRNPLAKAPIIIFNPEDSLKVTTVTTITDDLRKANKAKLQEYKNQGKNWVDEQLFGASSS